MSMKDRLSKKTEGLFVPQRKEPSTAAQGAAAAPLRTSPGQMLMVNSLMKENNEKLASLEMRLKEFDGVLPVRLVAADRIVASKWANRLEPSFQNADFAALKEEIARSEGNVQPIKLRPIGGGDQFEVVYGHRRHRACLELNLPVLALIEDVSEQDLFKEMDRENRHRRDLSPWEQGVMYRRALEENLFRSLGELSREIGIDKGNVSKALKLAELPETVVAAFSSPLDLQYRWAKLLSDALQANPERVLKTAKELATNGGALSAKQVLEALLGAEEPEVSEHVVQVEGKALAVIRREGERGVVRFERGALTKKRAEELEEFLVKLLRS